MAFRTISARSWLIPWSGATLLMGITIGVAVHLLHSVSPLRVWDRSCYDIALRHLARGDVKPAKVLLIEATPADLMNSEQLRRFVELARKHGARQLLVTVARYQLSAEFLAETANDPFVIVDQLHDTTGQLKRHSDVAVRVHVANDNRSDPVLATPPSDDGTWRREWIRVQADGTAHLSLEFAAAQREVPLDDLPQGDQFNVSFCGGAQSLPRLAFSRTLSGDLVPELAQGRTLLLGLELAPSDAGVVTPTTFGGDPMSVLEFRGHALNTLLNGETISECDITTRLLLLMTLGVLGIRLTDGRRVRRKLAATASLLFLEMSAAYLVLITARFWLPLSELIVVQLTALLATTLIRVGHLEGMLDRCNAQILSAVPQQAVRRAATNDTRHWQRMTQCLLASLRLRRVIVVQVSPEGQLTQLGASGCQQEDVIIRSLSHRGASRRAEMQTTRPICLPDDEPVLRHHGAGERQYLAELWTDNELIGLMALGIDIRLATPEFENQLRASLAQLTELLNDTSRSIGVAMTTDSLERVAADACRMARQQLQHVESALSQSTVPLAAFDLFGNLTVINRAMVNSLQSQQLIPHDLSPLELIAGLADCDCDLAMRILGHVVADGMRETVPAKHCDSPQTYLLQIRPWLEPSPLTRDPSIQGVLCELIDRTDYVEACQIKDHLTIELGNLLRNDLMGIGLAATLLRESDADEDERQSICALVQAKIETTVSTLEQCCHYVSSTSIGKEICVPVTPYAAMTEALAIIKPRADQHRVAIRTATPLLSSRVLAIPKRLPQVFVGCLDSLLSDAPSDSEIVVKVKQDSTQVSVVMQNQGFGVAARMLRRDDNPLQKQAASWQRFHEVARCLREWGGRIDVSESTTGGTTIELVFTRFGRPERTMQREVAQDVASASSSH